MRFPLVVLIQESEQLFISIQVFSANLFYFDLYSHYFTVTHELTLRAKLTL